MTARRPNVNIFKIQDGGPLPIKISFFKLSSRLPEFSEFQFASGSSFSENVSNVTDTGVP